VFLLYIISCFNLRAWFSWIRFFLGFSYDAEERTRYTQISFFCLCPSTCSWTISRIFTKFSIGVLYEKLLSCHAFCANRLSGSHTSVKGESEFLLVLFIFVDGFLFILFFFSVGHSLSSCEFREIRLRDVIPYFRVCVCVFFLHFFDLFG
jgi:hypothetical protein